MSMHGRASGIAQRMMHKHMGHYADGGEASGGPAAIIALKLRQKHGGMDNEESPDEGGPHDMVLESKASQILEAIRSNDPKGLAAALKAAFMVCDAMPHDEGPHEDEEEPDDMS